MTRSEIHGTMKHSTPAIIVTARRDGFRRLGIAHSAKGATYDAGRFSPEEIEVLKKDPNLVVVEVGAGKATGATDDPRPRDAVAVLAAIAAAFAELKPTDVGSDGKPVVKAVERVLGYDVTEAEVDYAWQRAPLTAHARLAKEQPAPEPAPEKPSSSLDGDSGAGSAGKGKGKTKS